MTTQKKQRFLTSRILLILIVIAAAFIAAFLGQVLITELSLSPSLLPENGIIVRTQTNDPASMRKHAQAIADREGSAHVRLFVAQDSTSASKEGWVVSNDGWVMTFAGQTAVEDMKFVRLNSGAFFAIKSSVTDLATGLRFVKIEQQRVQPLTISQRFEEAAFDPLISVSSEGLAASTSVAGWTLQPSANNRFSSDLVHRFPAVMTQSTVASALYNTNEELVCLLRPNDAASFGSCIPAEQIRISLDQVLRTATIVRPSLGVTYQDLAYTPAMSADQSAGASVVTVAGAASKAGLRVGDVITAVDGTPLSERLTLSEVVLRSKKGDKLELTVSRRNQPLSISVTLE